jgi:hypothetical protein
MGTYAGTTVQLLLLGVVALVTLGAIYALPVGCGPSLKGQRNLPATIHLLAVDQEGRPLAGVEFEFRSSSSPTTGRSRPAATRTPRSRPPSAPVRTAGLC